MTQPDEISKVVRQMRSRSNGLRNGDGYLYVPVDIDELTNWADRIESAIQLPIPNEIGSKSVDAPDEAQDTPRHVSWWARRLKEQEAITDTLARQLAEAKAEIDQRTAVYGLVVGSVCAALKRAGFDDCDDPGEAIDVMREGYEAQLAQATSRLAAVEGLSGDWRDQAKRLRNEVPNLRDGSDKRFITARDADRAADELDAALRPKELAK